MTRNSCKLILVLLACAAPLVAALVNAEPCNFPTDGLYALAEAGQGAPRQQAVPEIKPSSANDKGEVRAATPRNAAVARQGATGLGARAAPSGSLNSSPSGAQNWIVPVAAAGLLVSLAAAAYIAWSRARRAEVPATVLLPLSADNSPGLPTSDSEQQPERRAA